MICLTIKATQRRLCKLARKEIPDYILSDTVRKVFWVAPLMQLKLLLISAESGEKQQQMLAWPYHAKGAAVQINAYKL